MSDKGELQARWKELWDRIQERWGELTDEELQIVNGKYEQLVGLIQRKSGETREGVEKHLGEIARLRRERMAHGGSNHDGAGDDRPASTDGLLKGPG